MQNHKIVNMNQPIGSTINFDISNQPPNPIPYMGKWLTKIKKKCLNCNKDFLPNSNSQKVCFGCRKSKCKTCGIGIELNSSYIAIAKKQLRKNDLIVFNYPKYMAVKSYPQMKVKIRKSIPAR